jgi:hypothetical protein
MGNRRIGVNLFSIALAVEYLLETVVKYAQIRQQRWA